MEMTTSKIKLYDARDVVGVDASRSEVIAYDHW